MVHASRVSQYVCAPHAAQSKECFVTANDGNVHAKRGTAATATNKQTKYIKIYLWLACVCFVFTSVVAAVACAYCKSLSPPPPATVVVGLTTINAVTWNRINYAIFTSPYFFLQLPSSLFFSLFSLKLPIGGSTYSQIHATGNKSENT